MKFVGLILKSARRSKRRTALTMISVALAVFLFSALRAVLDGFDAVSAASSSTRLVTIRSTSMIFSMPTSHTEVVKSTPGVQDITWASWFGGIYKDPKNFFGQFAVDPESYLRMYPEIIVNPEDRKAFMLEDAQPPVLLTEEALVESLPAHTAQLLCLDRDWPQHLRSRIAEETSKVHRAHCHSA